VGQVQDAGLIFLSAMAGSIVESVQSDMTIPNKRLSTAYISTTLVVLSVYTALLGLLLILIGRLKLASVIQYMPMPVIGGYLAFIGLFCGQAGLALMAGVELKTIADWGLLFESEKTLLLIIPGVVAGVGTYVLLRNVRSAFTLPACMGGILVGFYFVLWLSGASLEDARENGWVFPVPGTQEGNARSITLSLNTK
jgi:sulfate permease, SulP family